MMQVKSALTLWLALCMHTTSATSETTALPQPLPEDFVYFLELLGDDTWLADRLLDEAQSPQHADENAVWELADEN